MSLAEKVVPHATRADLEQLPSTWRGEIFERTLYASPRPRAPHADVEGIVVEALRSSAPAGTAACHDNRSFEIPRS
jgi:hypothetical protein